MEQKITRLLAKSLSNAKRVSRNGIIKSADLNSTDRTRLSKSGWLTEIIRGWYMLVTPDVAGSSTAWFGGFWAFVSYYLADRFGKHGYCLSAESSLDLHVGETSIASQLVVITQKTSNQTINLPHNTSLLLYGDSKNFPDEKEKINGVNVMPLPLALSRVSNSYFKLKPLNAEIALKLVKDESGLSRVLLENELSAAAGRIVGAYRFIGDNRKAKRILDDMTVAGYVISEKNPFTRELSLKSIDRLTSPYVGRIQAMWQSMREVVIRNFPKAPGMSKGTNRPIKLIQEIHVKDAYHSLSIEGYQVTEELINKIERGGWNPASDADDRRQRDVLAAKGYHNAFKVVLDSIVKVLNGKNPGRIVEEDLQVWYRNMLSPLIEAGLIGVSELAGYRGGQVYIRNSRHVPPSSYAVLDSMETLFKLLIEETEPGVRAVLGHFIFEFIHPYMDGNGRIGRFMMNLMLVSGGYNWTPVRISERKEYMSSLEEASAKGNIKRFTKFLAKEMNFWKRGLQTKGKL